MMQWARQLHPLGRGSLFYFFFWGMIAIYIPFLNVYLQGELGFQGREIGLLSMINPVMMIFVALPLATYADKHRRRKLVLGGLLGCFGLLMLFAHYPQTFQAWLAFMVLMAILFSPMLPLVDTLVARMAEWHQLNYGTMRLFGSVGFAMIAISCGFLWERVGYSWMFLTTALAVIPVLFWIATLEERGQPVTVTSEPENTPSVRRLLDDAGLVTLYLTAFMVGMAIHSSIMFDGIYMKFLGGSERFVGLMFGVSALCELPTMQYSRHFINRLSGPRTLLLACTVFGFAYIGYTIAWSPVVLLMMTGIKGLGFGLFYVSAIQVVTRRTPDSVAATAQSILGVSGFGVAPILASLIVGELFDMFGPRAVYIFCAMALGAASLIVTVAIRRGLFKDAPPKPTQSHNGPVYSH